jgi:cytidine deaminase
MTDDTLLRLALEAQARAYAPYSGFKVGAAIEAEDGSVTVGANIENASYGVTLCAERIALGAAVTAGMRRFTRLVIVSDASPPSAPCGACRQALSEFGLTLRVDAVGGGVTRSWELADLLPDAFGPEDLTP